ncbi:MAG: endonuclease V, partial [Candidatus Odinarchaeota archaeon]
RSLLMKPDILMVNAHGIAHPLQCGCASYIGVLTDTPTIGVSKTEICGETIKCEGEKDIAYLKFNSKIIGAVINPDKNSRRIIVSPGHRVSLKTAVQITLKTLGNSRLPIILEEAHRRATKLSGELLREQH